MKRGGLQPDGSYILDDSEHYFTFDEKSEKFYSEDQPRDDHGRWTDEGGGAGTRDEKAKMEMPAVSVWGTEATQIAYGPFDKDEADVRTAFGHIPEGHLDGLAGGVELSVNLQFNNEFGNYDPTTSKIQIGLRDGYPDVTTEMRVLHEAGHHVHLAKLDEAAAKEWAALSRDGKAARITEYAKGNAGDHFAEAYRYYYGAPHLKEALRDEEPRVYDFFTRLGEHLLPKGNVLGVRARFGRFDPILQRTLIKEGKI